MTASYSTNDPKGWCGDPSRGAALGRPTVEDGPPIGKITVRHSPLDRQGYDTNGTYFGDGEPLYWYADEGGNVDAMLRARWFEEALEKVRRKFPGVEVEMGEPVPLRCWGAGEDACPDNAMAHEDYGDQCEECALADMIADDEADEDLDDA